MEMHRWLNCQGQQWRTEPSRTRSLGRCRNRCRTSDEDCHIVIRVARRGATVNGCSTRLKFQRSKHRQRTCRRRQRPAISRGALSPLISSQPDPAYLRRRRRRLLCSNHLGGLAHCGCHDASSHRRMKNRSSPGPTHSAHCDRRWFLHPTQHQRIKGSAHTGTRHRGQDRAAHDPERVEDRSRSASEQPERG